MRGVVILLWCLCGLLAGVCAQAQSPRHLFERGLASWYGEPFDGREAASGEIYSQDLMTAAHRTLPFGTRVKVRRLDSIKSVIVRINDRGPYVDSRIIDLSRAAAVRLGMMRQGVAPVVLEVVKTPDEDLRSAFSVELSSAMVKQRPWVSTAGMAQ